MSRRQGVEEEETSNSSIETTVDHHGHSSSLKWFQVHPLISDFLVVLDP